MYIPSITFRRRQLLYHSTAKALTSAHWYITGSLQAHQFDRCPVLVQRLPERSAQHVTLDTIGQCTAPRGFPPKCSERVGILTTSSRLVGRYAKSSPSDGGLGDIFHAQVRPRALEGAQGAIVVALGDGVQCHSCCRSSLFNARPRSRLSCSKLRQSGWGRCPPLLGSRPAMLIAQRRSLLNFTCQVAVGKTYLCLCSSGVHSKRPRGK